jgi:hypothetical protein
MYSKEKDGQKRYMGSMMEMARLLKYFKTGTLTGHFDPEKLVELIELIPQDLRNSKADVSIPELDSKESSSVKNDFESMEKRFRKTWETYLAKEVKSEEKQEEKPKKKKSKTYKVDSLDYPKDGYRLNNPHAYLEQIAPETMCPYYSIPFIVKVTEPKVIAGSKVQLMQRVDMEALIRTKKQTSPKRAKKPEKQQMIDPNTGNYVSVDENGNTTEIKDNEVNDVKPPETLVQNGEQKTDDDKDAENCFSCIDDQHTVNADDNQQVANADAVRKEVKEDETIPAELKREFDSFKAKYIKKYPVDQSKIAAIDEIVTKTDAQAFIRKWRNAFINLGFAPWKLLNMASSNG